MIDFSGISNWQLSREIASRYNAARNSGIMKKLLGQSWWSRTIGSSSILGRLIGAPILVPLGLSILAISIGERAVGSIIDLFDIRPTLKDEVRNTINSRIDQIATVTLAATFIIAIAIVMTRKRT